MTSIGPGKRRLLVALQILAGLLMPLCFIAMVSTIAAVPREEALKKGRGPLPPEWEWVVPNHGSYYPWPFHGPILAVLFFTGMVGCVAFIFVTARRYSNKK